MDKVGGRTENEAEDQDLARALEESLRHYKEVELPRLSQITKEADETKKKEEYEDNSVCDVWDCWEEWDDEQIVNAVQVEQSVNDDVCIIQENISNKVKRKEVNSMNNYVNREIIPKRTSVSLGEVGQSGADGFDHEAGRLWIYPCNYPVRKYQLDIVHSALFDNTLVSLPTGLGKTFIAAVVMYNYYRWFPLGKVIFLAPTRPLVAQQIRACYEIMGIPRDDTLELTGSKNATERAKHWKEKRVFFATPQVAANDLATGACPGDLVRCVVIDEAHRAAGNHAICQAIRGLLRLREQSPGSRFRILALSATPGKDVQAVSNVVTTLRISKLELRDEQSPDVAPYTHQRNAETIVVPLGRELSETRNKFLSVMDPFVDRLMNKRLLYCSQKYKLNKFQILQARANFRANPPPGMDYSQKGLAEADFAVCITLTHALGLLLTHGERTFMSFIQGIIDGDRGTQVVRGKLSHNIPLLSLLSDLKEKLGGANSMLQPAPDVSLSEGMVGATEMENVDKPFITSHPKMVQLRKVVIEHFEKFQRNEESTRVMIFCEYRDPVVEICNMLMRHWPLVKPMSFVGQASSFHADPNTPGTSKGTKGFTQKQQLQALRGFRDGGYNVLVSTCVGEEGLDIGEVDLIVCYDAPHASPLRLVQRMGRTGRKREGRVVTLVTQDWEEHKHRMGVNQKNKIVKSLMSSKVLAGYLCRSNPRILPPGAAPDCHIMPMTIPEYNPEDIKTKKGKGKTEKNKIMKKNVKGKKKVKGRNEDELSEDENNEKFKGEDDGEENEAIEQSGASVAKGKGKGKSKKRDEKVGKGIRDFFKQKVKVCKSNIEPEEEVIDDDFVDQGQLKTKALNESQDVIILNDCMNSDIQPPNSAADDPVSDVKDPFILPPELMALENAVTSYFQGISYPENDYKYSEIAPLFQIYQYTVTVSPLEDVPSLEFLTKETLRNFNTDLEAKKVESWKSPHYIPSPAKEIDSFLHENEFNAHFIENLNMSPFSHEILSTGKKPSTVNKMVEIDVKSIRESSVKAKLPRNTKCSVIQIAPQISSEQNLLWTVYGNKTDKLTSVDSENICDVVKRESYERKGHIKSCIMKETSPRKLISKNDSFNKTPTKQNRDVINISPDDYEVRSADRDRNGIPDNIPLQEISYCSPSGSPILKSNKSPFLMASSTPKVHRKNLFPVSECLTSPIAAGAKNSADANFDLLPSGVEFSDDEFLSESCMNNLSPKKMVEAPDITSRRSLPKVVKPVEIEILNYEVPNFDLGWENEFSSDSSDVTFVDFENLEQNVIEDVKSIPAVHDNDEFLTADDKLESILKETPKSGISKSFKHVEYNSTLEKKGDDSSKGYVEKSSEIYPATRKMGPFSRPRHLILKGKCENETENSEYCSNDSFTVTQMVDLLAGSEFVSKTRESHVMKSEASSGNNELVQQSISDELNSHFCEKIDSKEMNWNFRSAEVDNYIPDKVLDVFDTVDKPETDAKNENVEAIKEEINFDVGGETFFNVSADLFAEDDVEEWLRESGQAKEDKQVGDEVKMLDEKKTTSSDLNIKVKSNEQNEELIGEPYVEELKCSQATMKKNNIIHESKDILPKTAITDLPVWNVDNWLSKPVLGNKNKLSLGQKDKKRKVEIEPKIVDLDLHENNNLFNQVSSQRVGSSDIVIKPEQGEFVKQSEKISKNHEIIVKRCRLSDELSKYENDRNEVASEKMGEEKQMFVKDENRKVKHVNKLSANELELVSKSKVSIDVVTLSSDSSQEDINNKRPLSNLRKPIGDIKGITKYEEVDAYELNEGWNNLEHQDGEKSEDDDFTTSDMKRNQTAMQKKLNSKNISISSEEKTPVRPRNLKRRRRRCDFLDSQAEVSFLEDNVRKLSSDEDDDENKGNSQYYDPSFINDGLPHSQENDIDIQAKYLQSVRSPRNAKFKIPNLPLLVPDKQNTSRSSPDAYLPDPSESCYMNDSFCVDGEDECDEKEDHEETVDELEELEAILAKKEKRRRNQKTLTSSEDEIEIIEEKRPVKEMGVESKQKKRKRKRIIVHDSSDEEEQSLKPPTKRMSTESDDKVQSLHSDKNSAKDKKFVEMLHNIKSEGQQNKSKDMFGSNSSSGSSSFTERRSTKLNTSTVNKGGKNKTGQESGHTMNSINVSKEEGHIKSKKRNNSGICLEKKEAPDLLDEIAFNWSADLFDNWDLLDDIEPITHESKSINSHKTDEFLTSLNNIITVESDKHNKQDDSKTSKCQHPSSFNTNVKQSLNNQNKAESSSVNSEKQCKPNISGNSSSSHEISSDLKRCTVVNHEKTEKSAYAGHSKHTTLSSSKTCVVAPYLSCKDLPATSSVSMQSECSAPSNSETLIIISPMEACRATEVVSVLRMISQVRVLVFATGGSTSVPYAVGRNMCLYRCSSSELGRGSKIADSIKSAHKLFSKITIIVEWEDRNQDQNMPWLQKRTSNWNSSSGSTTITTSMCMAFLNFRDAGIRMLHSSSKAESAKLIADVAKHHQKLETNFNMQPIMLPKSFDPTSSKLKFYASLPGINAFKAIDLLQRFPKVSSFLSKCSSAHAIQAAAGIDMNKALQLYKLLSNVFISDT